MSWSQGDVKDEFGLRKEVYSERLGARSRVSIRVRKLKVNQIGLHAVTVQYGMDGFVALLPYTGDVKALLKASTN